MTIKMKKLAKIILFSCLSISALSFSSCSFQTDSHYATVTVLVRNNEFTSQNTETTTGSASERTATPVLPDSITYSLTATEIINGATPRTYSSDPSEAQADETFPAAKNTC